MSSGKTPPAHSRADLITGTACYLFASLSWGANLPLTAQLFRAFDPFLLSTVRVAMASVILGALLFATQRPARLALGMSFGRFALTSLAAACFFALYNLGIRYTNPITAAALMAGVPVYTAITMRLVMGTALERGFGGAAILTLIGAGVAIYGRANASGQTLVLQGGEPLILLALVCWVLYSIAAQRWFEPKAPQLWRTCTGLAGASVWLVLIWGGLHGLGLAGALHGPLETDLIVWLLITAVFSTALGGYAWNIGVARIGLAAGSIWQNTVPVFGVLIAMLFGLVPTIEQVAGGVIVLTGVGWMQWRKSRPH